MRATFEVPWPPSVNHLWRRGKNGGMYLSKAGREYRKEVFAVWAQQGKPKFSSRNLSVSIVASPPDNRRRDLDNVLKAVLDSLVACGCIRDDSDIGELTIQRDNGLLGKLTIEVIDWREQP